MKLAQRLHAECWWRIYMSTVAIFAKHGNGLWQETINVLVISWTFPYQINNNTCLSQKENILLTLLFQGIKVLRQAVHADLRKKTFTECHIFHIWITPSHKKVLWACKKLQKLRNFSASKLSWYMVYYTHIVFRLSVFWNTLILTRRAGRMPGFLELLLSANFCMCVCLFVCPPPGLSITSGVI